MNVAAIKQVVPYARFLVRASMEKRRPTVIDGRSGAIRAGMTMRPKAVSAALLLVAAAFLATFAAVAGPAALAFGLLSQADLLCFPAC